MGVMARRGLVFDMRGRDGDAARLLLGRGVDLVVGLVLAEILGDRRRQRRLAMIDMPDRPDVHVRLRSAQTLPSPSWLSLLRGPSKAPLRDWAARYVQTPGSASGEVASPAAGDVLGGGREEGGRRWRATARGHGLAAADDADHLRGGVRGAGPAFPPRCRALPGDRPAAALLLQRDDPRPRRDRAEQVAALDALRAEGRAGLSASRIGFCRLDRDLAARGLAVLFEASWLWAPAAAFEAAAGPAGWERVTTPAGARGVGGGLGCGGFADREPPVIFPPRCWRTRPSPSSAGAAGRGMTPAASATARRAASGFPASSRRQRTETVFAAAAVLVACLAPGVPLVGYHRGAPLAATLRIGFREVGRLRV